MANVLVQESSLSAIADAIRAKNGTQNTYKPSQMADAIEAISGGGITPSGTISITQNGTVDVTQYASASVNVPTGTTPTGTKQVTITQNGTTTEDVSVYANAEITVNVSGGSGNDDMKSLLEGTLTSITNNATSIRTHAFENATNLETASFPLATIIKTSAFSSTSKLTSLNIPLVQTIEANGLTSTGLPLFIAPSCTSIGNTCFNNASKLTAVEFGVSVTLGNSAFYSNTLLDTVVFRGDSVATLKNGTVFGNTKFASGNDGGTIYVPASLKSAYEADSKFAAILSGNSNNQILAIENSIYATQHIDGTSI